MSGNATMSRWLTSCLSAGQAWEIHSRRKSDNTWNRDVLAHLGEKNGVEVYHFCGQPTDGAPHGDEFTSEDHGEHIFHEHVDSMLSAWWGFPDLEIRLQIVEHDNHA